jgi:hypothetical protein
MNVAMMQPSFMPWQGYFELICKSEIFVFLDDFQFSVQSYHQRNRLFINKGQVDWYTVPVKKKTFFKGPLNKTYINEDVRWRIKMWRSIEQTYSKAPYFPEISRSLKDHLLKGSNSLADLNIGLIKTICSVLNIEREFRYSSEYPTSSDRSSRVLELLNWCNAGRYFCAKGAFDYMLEDGLFPDSKVEVFFQDFVPKEYKQISSVTGFVPFLSVVDSLMNVGPKETFELIKGGTSKWLSWEDMKEGQAVKNRPL